MLLLLISSHINEFNHNTTQTHFKLPLKKYIYIINQKSCFSYSHILLLQIMTLFMTTSLSLSLSSFHPGIPQSEPRAGLSSVSASLFNLVNFLFTHIHCDVHHICNYKFFFFVSVKTNIFNASTCSAPQSSSASLSRLLEDAVATSSHLQHFSAVRKLTRDLQQQKPRYPKDHNSILVKLTHP